MTRTEGTTPTSLPGYRRVRTPLNAQTRTYFMPPSLSMKSRRTIQPIQLTNSSTSSCSEVTGCLGCRRRHVLQQQRRALECLRGAIGTSRQYICSNSNTTYDHCQGSLADFTVAKAYYGNGIPLANDADQYLPSGKGYWLRSPADYLSQSAILDCVPCYVTRLRSTTRSKDHSIIQCDDDVTRWANLS